VSRRQADHSSPSGVKVLKAWSVFMCVT
jgi:hypothetical protein